MSSNAARKRWREANPERVRAYEKAYAEKHGRRRYLNGVRRKYGLTPESYEEMFQAQGGVCKICLLSKKLVVDHDHSPPYAVRGLLCDECNKMLGHGKDNLATFERAALYIKGDHMPGFKDALKSYKQRDGAAKATEETPVPVNPPEAKAVLTNATEPETEGKAEPAPLEVAKPKATRAPRGSKAKSAEQTESTASAQETVATLDDLVESLVALGYIVTLTKGPLS